MMARRVAAPRGEVPFLHEKSIEAEAELVLGEYAEKFGPIVVPPTPIEQIAEMLLQLVLEFKDMKALFPFADVHGAIWFTEGRIGIEQRLEPQANPSRRGRYHFTLAHEVGHWRLHRSHYQQNPAERRLFDDGTPKPDVVCRSSERKKPVEWQADNFASCLLMPRKLIYDAWHRFRSSDGPVTIAEIRRQYVSLLAVEPFVHRGKLVTTEAEKDNAVKEEFSRPLADEFQVSPEAMRIRLETLKLIVNEKPTMLF
jgi:Zn-dependent peptidase ImmA (M78 family)